MDDLDLCDVQASLRGDGDAFGRIVRRHQSQLSTRMWRFTRDRQVLEELVQEVFVECYTHLASFKGTGAFSHWVNAIATRVGYRFWKRQKKAAEKTINLEEWDLPALARQERPDPQLAADALHAMLSKLPPRDRLVLTLMYLDELPLAQVARQTGWSLTMVKVQAHRARKKLRALMQKHGMSDLLETQE
ncbi:MAG: RNA polymerase sigma factor [Phycisphaerae bacterium]|jgi:RNA polymerase sigma-70 factor (ECF subfamily)